MTNIALIDCDVFQSYTTVNNTDLPKFQVPNSLFFKITGACTHESVAIKGPVTVGLKCGAMLFNIGIQ